MNPNKNPHPGVTARVVFLSPVWAKKLIESNSANQRNVSRDNLAKAEGSLRNDSFVLNGESVIVSDRGRLLDGQHRALAVVNTGIGIWTVLVEGIPDEYFATIDSGKSRSYANVLQISGESHSTHLSSTVQRLAEYLRDPKSVGLSTPISHADLNLVRQMEPDLGESCAALKHNRTMPPSRGAWLYHLAKKVDAQVTQHFFDRLSDGQMLAADSPIYRLRERLVNERRGGEEKRKVIKLREAMALLIKAWNAYVRGQSLRLLKWDEREQFPVLDLNINASRKEAA